MGNRKTLRSEILGDYDRKRHLYLDLSATLSQLLQRLLSDQGIVLHTVTARCKDRSSLEGKLSRPGKSYSNLNEVTDIAGIRLTTYFADDVDRVAEVLERELSIDRSASVDKRIQSDPDRFGYQSLHYIAQLSPERTQLREYQRFDALRFEIQIRSVLQHAWAEIEHDLGYKSALGIPAEVKRRFARVASLLELADSEFTAIRSQLSSYEQALPSKIASDPSTALIDLPALILLVGTDVEIRRLDSDVCNAGGGTLEEANPDQLGSMVDRLRFFGISTVGELRATASQHRNLVGKFAEYWLEKDLGEVNRGIGLFYLCYVLAWKSKDRELIEKYLNSSNIDREENRYSLASEIAAFDPTS